VMMSSPSTSKITGATSGFPVGDAVANRISGCDCRYASSASALHFYERQGLITSVRNEGNQRRFGRDTLRRLAFIRAAQSVGISLTDIRDALDALPQQRTPREADWTRLAEGWRDQLDRRIEQLERLRDDLTTCIGCGCLSFEQCKLTNPADRLSVEGPGARRFSPGTPRPER
jgi:MerR family redox-sensitive transcriptional activator SoxR